MLQITNSMPKADAKKIREGPKLRAEAEEWRRLFCCVKAQAEQQVRDCLCGPDEGQVRG